MRARIAGLVAVALVVGAAAVQAQDLQSKPRASRYRLAYGIPAFNGLHYPSAFGVSTSMDIFERAPLGFVGRLDATVLGGKDGISTVTMDAVRSLRILRLPLYGAVGFGIAAERGMTAVGAGGIDFTFRERSLFAELRLYRQGDAGLFKLGLRF